ncbi:MAG TPA: hypothetical protein VGM54_20185 [Chthoniobacter sp.]|jgi:hypothetical protein
MKLFPPLAALLLSAVLARATTPQELALQPYQAPPAPDAKDWPREKILGFMHELADFVEKNHVVTDPARKTYGMVYEFWKDGKKMQEFGLDSMHDGAWFMSSLIVAQRADPKGDWLARAQKYEIPFYTNLLNHSDQLFPKMQPTEEDKNPFPAPLKGWAPRGWDDGSGFSRKSGQPLPDAYFTGSNHLSEDLADALLNVWLSTRDPQVAEAARHLRDYKRDYFGPIQGVDIAADLTAGQADAFLKYRFPEFSPRSLVPCSAGLFENKAASLLVYDDGLAWTYRQATAGAWISGELQHGFTSHLIARCYGAITSMESFFDDQPYPYGAWFFDIQRPPAYVDGKGKLDAYSSTSKDFYGSRGVQFAWLAAAVLPELKAQPGLWDNALKINPGEAIVRMVDQPPTTDGVKDEVYGKSAPLGDETAQVTLISDPRNLHVFIETTRPQLTVTFQEENGETHALEEAAMRESESHGSNHKKRTKSKSGSGENGESAHKKDGAEKENSGAEPPEPLFLRGGKLTVSKDGKWTAVNEKGESLLSVAVFKPGPFKQGNGDNWIAEVRIPYTFVPGQNAWINGVDFGRYRVGIDTAPPRTICILSESARIRKRLENCVLGTIDYWHKVWTERGIIPSGWHSPTAPAGAWELSDTGGYAHLIHAMAYWLIYQDGDHEWQLIREQFPSAPKPAPALPMSVLKAQGLK